MAPEKTTLMVLKVDLQCDRCYQKVKRTLCRFPQVRDQLYNDKENIVTIKVVCCSPEKIRDKICVKGGRSIKSIQIVEAKPPPPPAGKPPKNADPAPPAEKPKDKAPPPAEKPKDKAPPPAEKPKDKAPPPAEKPKDQPQGPSPDKIQKSGSKNAQKPDQQAKPPAAAPGNPDKPDPKPAKPDPKPAPPPQQPMPPQAMMQSVPMGIPGYPPPPGIYPVNMHWGSYYDGQPSGMYAPPPPPHMSDPYGYYGSGGWNSRPPGPAYCATRSDYFSDENPQACVIM